MMKNKLLFKQIDKANHFIVGYLIYCLSFIFIGYWSVIPVVLIAFLKEVNDWYFKNNFDWCDFIYTIAGIIPTLTIQMI